MEADAGKTCLSLCLWRVGDVTESTCGGGGLSICVFKICMASSWGFSFFTKPLPSLLLWWTKPSVAYNVGPMTNTIYRTHKCFLRAQTTHLLISGAGSGGGVWYCLMMSFMLWLGMMCSELETEYLTTSVAGAGTVRIGPETATGAEKEREREKLYIHITHTQPDHIYKEKIQSICHTVFLGRPVVNSNGLYWRRRSLFLP